MSTTYEVILALKTQGDLLASVSKVGSAAEKAESAVAKMGDRAKSASSAFESMGQSVGNALGSIVDKVTDVGLGLAKWGAVAAVGVLAYGVANLNSSLEQTQNSFAAIFQAQGISPNFQSALSVSADQVSKMKKDVMTLPGTFTQLAQLMQTTATTGIAAGMDADALRKFAGRTMLTASIVAPTIDNNLLSKEIVNLLAGKAGTHNILGLRLGLQGDEAKKFNALAPEARLAELNKIYDKYKDATDAIGVSWKAQFTSLKDNVLFKILQPVTQPLFEHVKADLMKLNDWFVKNQSQIEHYVNIVAYRLADAWDKVIDTVGKLGPMMERMERFMERFHLSDISAAVKDIGLSLLGAKALSYAIPAATSLAAPAIGQVLAGTGLTGISVVSFLGAATLAAVGFAGAGAADNITNANGNFHESTMQDVEGIKKSAKSLWGTLEQDFEHFRPYMDMAGRLLTNQFDAILRGADIFAQSVELMLEPIDQLGYGISKLMPGFKDMVGIANGVFNPIGYITDKSHLNTPQEWSANHPQPQPRDFGTTIQKVEIVVKGSDDPTRVARLTLEKLLEISRHKTSSPFVARP